MTFDLLEYIIDHVFQVEVFILIHDLLQENVEISKVEKK